MAMLTYIDPAEAGAKAEAIFWSKIRPLPKVNLGKLVLIDIDLEVFVTGDNELALEERLLSERPGANMVLLCAAGKPTGQLG